VIFELFYPGYSYFFWSVVFAGGHALLAECVCVYYGFAHSRCHVLCGSCIVVLFCHLLLFLVGFVGFVRCGRFRSVHFFAWG